jgi:hypothetical protein
MKVKQVIFFLLLFSIKRSNLELHYDQFQFLDFIFTWNSGVACASLCQIIFSVEFVPRCISLIK